MSASMREISTPVASVGVAARRIAASNAVSAEFFRDNVESIALACQAMAARFQASARLLVWGDATVRSDVAHIVVEFVHPVIVGKRALPALALPVADGATIAEASSVFEALAVKGDMLMLLQSGAISATGDRLLAQARGGTVLTIALTGAESATAAAATATDFRFAVPSHDPCVVQETHEMLYHVLWELVHVFFDHRMAT